MDTITSPIENEEKLLQKVSPIHLTQSLGQSSMLSHSSDNSYSQSDDDFVPPDSTSSPGKSSSSDDFELIRKPSIQELVNQAEDFTPTQRIDDFDDDDDLSLPINIKENSIVEFDDDQFSDKDDYFEQNDDTIMPNEKLLRAVPEVKKVNENMPSPRWGSTMTMIDDSKLLVYGGQGYDTKTKKAENFSDLHVYDLNKKTWKKPVNCEGKIGLCIQMLHNAPCRMEHDY